MREDKIMININKKRLIEKISIYSFLILWTISIIKIISSTITFKTTLISGFLSIIVANFLSGLVHWTANTWGSIKIPIIGNYIKSFREHHVNPSEINQHDYIETNGDNCLVALPLLLYVNIMEEKVFLVWLATWIAITNQIHKWSHMNNAPNYIRFLQKNRMILSKRDHHQHHIKPFDCNYCITTGWLNPILTKIGFWRGLEKIITLITGYKPREDDIFWSTSIIIS